MPNIRFKKHKKIHIIINPASGRIEPILPIINQVMTKAEMAWDVSVTKKFEDAALFAKEALKKNVDVVAVYGGDGTVMEVMRGMMGSDIPVAILPGGTANVLATDLKIPNNLKEACELICDGNFQLKKIDVGQFNKKHFMLRLGLGFEADMVKGAKREIKNRFGRLAYVLSSVAAFRKIKEVKYTLTIDGQEEQATGITCIVANSGSIGFADLKLHHAIDVSDGLLDVVIVRRVSIGLFAHVLGILFRHKPLENVEVVKHWQGKHITVSSHPKQTAQCDGEVLEKIPLEAKVIPAAFQVIVPLETPPK